MSKFKVGDRITVIKDTFDPDDDYIGLTGVIDMIDNSSYPYGVDFGNDRHHCYCDEELKLAEEETECCPMCTIEALESELELAYETIAEKQEDIISIQRELIEVQREIIRLSREPKVWQ